VIVDDAGAGRARTLRIVTIGGAGYGDLVERLEAIAAELDDLAFDQLREAVADGATARPVDDRRLMQARRAIDKAAAHRRQAGGGEASDDWST
jgi:hypothetical protein